MNTAILLIILIPIIEIYLFIKIGGQIGAFTTISLIFITAIIGVFYARYEGLNNLRSGVSQLYKHDVKKDDEIILTIYWHPLTIAERESILKKSGNEDANDFALALMIQKALDKDGNRLFQDGDKASLRREVEANILQEIQLAMMEAGINKEGEQAEADLKS